MEYNPQIPFDKINFDYNCTAEFHYTKAVKLLNAGGEFSQIIYCALETRICIERLCFEYLVLITHRNRSLTVQELKLYKPKQLFERVEKEKPMLEKEIDFINAYMRNSPFDQMIPPDFQWLNSTHGKINDYLHLQKFKLDLDKKNRLLAILEETLKRLKGYILGRKSISSLRPHAKPILDNYLSGKIDKSQMERMLRISDLPPYMYSSNED